MNVVHITKASWHPEKEVSGGLNDRQRTPSLRLPEPCGCYAEEYAAGKDEAYFEMLASLEGTPAAGDCACQSCQVKRACLQKVMTLQARSSPAPLELVGVWAPEAHDGRS